MDRLDRHRNAQARQTAHAKKIEAVVRGSFFLLPLAE